MILFLLRFLDQIIKSKVSNVANAIVIINDYLVKFQFQKLDPTQTDIYFQVEDRSSSKCSGTSFPEIVG